MNIGSCRQVFLAVLVIKVSSAANDDNVAGRPESGDKSAKGQQQKLMIILVDGLRWDYYHLNKDKLPGFRHFLETGVAAEYVEPVFPSLSLPSWTTLVTGLYPAHHQIVDNHMLLRSSDKSDIIFNFVQNSSTNPIWWQDAEPLWITATKQGHKVFLSDFSRCDVPFHGQLPEEYTGYGFKIADKVGNLRTELRKALDRFRHQNFSLAMLYYEWVDEKAHQYGVNSPNMLESLQEMDVALQELLYNLQLFGLQQSVNVVITGDHGGTDVRKSLGTKYVHLSRYLRRNIQDVEKVVGFGPTVMIATAEGKADTVFRLLKDIPGVLAYKKEDIPEEMHQKESKYVLDILLVCQPGYMLVGLESGDKQLPANNWIAYTEEPFPGQHGYWNMSDMRTVFYALGPAFKKGGGVRPGIRLEDQYQIFAYVLGIHPRPHNGSWARVGGMLVNAKQILYK